MSLPRERTTLGPSGEAASASQAERLRGTGPAGTFTAGFQSPELRTHKVALFKPHLRFHGSHTPPCSPAAASRGCLLLQCTHGLLTTAASPLAERVL